MGQKKIISLGAVLVALIAVIGFSIASMAATDNQSTDSQNALPAYCGHRGSWQNRPELTDAQKQEMEAKRQAIDNALDNNNYQSWLQAVGTDSDRAKKITADNFPQLVKAHQLEQQAKELIDQARQIREQLGLKIYFKEGKGPEKCPCKGLNLPVESN